MDREPVRDLLPPESCAHWRRYGAGAGAVESSGPTLRFVVSAATSSEYSNAQIDDCQGLPRRRFLWRPPLRLTVRAHFSHPAGDGPTTGQAILAGGLRGTAGFGFWNDPFLMTGARMPALPRAIWFFYASRPSNMKLDLNVAGHGWKAATVDATHPSALLLAPLAPATVLLMKAAPLYRALWPPIQRVLRVREARVEAKMTEPHTYVIDWGVRSSTFSVDGELILGDAPSPRGPLGFVMWLDNQYLVATPQGHVRWGLLDVPGTQWMAVDQLMIDSL